MSVLVPAATICAWGVWSITVRIAGRALRAVIGMGFGLLAGVPLVVGGVLGAFTGGDAGVGPSADSNRNLTPVQEHS